MNQSVGGASRSNSLMFSVSGEQKSEKRKQRKGMMGEQGGSLAPHKSAARGRKNNDLTFHDNTKAE